MSEKPTKMLPKCSQNLSEIDPGGALEATWEPPLKQGASKTSFLMSLAPFWDRIWEQFGLFLGIILLDSFVYAHVAATFASVENWTCVLTLDIQTVVQMDANV